MDMRYDDPIPGVDAPWLLDDPIVDEEYEAWLDAVLAEAERKLLRGEDSDD